MVIGYKISKKMSKNLKFYLYLCQPINYLIIFSIKKTMFCDSDLITLVLKYTKCMDFQITYALMFNCHVCSTETVCTGLNEKSPIFGH